MVDLDLWSILPVFSRLVDVINNPLDVLRGFVFRSRFRGCLSLRLRKIKTELLRRTIQWQLTLTIVEIRLSRLSFRKRFSLSREFTLRRRRVIQLKAMLLFERKVTLLITNTRIDRSTGVTLLYELGHRVRIDVTTNLLNLVEDLFGTSILEQALEFGFRLRTEPMRTDDTMRQTGVRHRLSQSKDGFTRMDRTGQIARWTFGGHTLPSLLDTSSTHLSQRLHTSQDASTDVGRTILGTENTEFFLRLRRQTPLTLFTCQRVMIPEIKDIA